jgi:DNA processing protein
LNHGAIRRDFAETDTDDLEAAIIWNCLVEPGDRVSGKLRSEFGNRKALEKVLTRDHLTFSELSSDDLASAYERWLPRYREDLLEVILAQAARNDMKLLLPTDPQWPESLSGLESFGPTLIWYRGNIQHFQSLNRAIGIVGSRTITNYGQRVTADLVSALARESAAVISGGALGVDAVAHRVSLAQKGLTVSVMAGSLDNLYPSGNWQLFEEIAHQGLLISELPPGSKPTRWRFLQRNRLIAALSEAVVVTEAGWRSGSINTASHANELGKRVFAIPGAISNPSSAGCNRLIRDQMAELLLDVEDLSQELGWSNANFPINAAFGSLELRVLDVLTTKEQDLAIISAKAGLTEQESKLGLGGLQLAGRAERGEKGSWKRTK